MKNKLKIKFSNSTLPTAPPSFYLNKITLYCWALSERDFPKKLIKPEALNSLYHSPGYKKNQLVLCN